MRIRRNQKGAAYELKAKGRNVNADSKMSISGLQWSPVQRKTPLNVYQWLAVVPCPEENTANGSL